MELFINVLILIGIFVLWVVINGIMIHYIGKFYYNITGIVSVLLLISLFISPNPYLNYCFVSLIALGWSNIMAGDILHQNGKLTNEEYWT